MQPENSDQLEPKELSRSNVLHHSPLVASLDMNYGLNTSSSTSYIEELIESLFTYPEDQYTCDLNSGPDIYYDIGIQVRGSQPPDQMPVDKTTIDTSNDLGPSPNGQLQAIDGSKDNVVPTEQTFMASPSVSPMSGVGVSLSAHSVAENNNEAPIMPTSGANSQLKNVGGSQHQNLESNHVTSETTDLLASLASNAPKTGSEPQRDWNKDVKAQLLPKDNQTPGGGELLQPHEILEKIGAQLDDIGNIELSLASKVTIGKKRVSSESKDHILKRKKVQGATKNGFAYDSNINIVEEPQDSIRMLRAGISDKARQYRKYTPEETKLLIDAVDKHHVGNWENIRGELPALKRTGDELKGKWRSLVRTAKTPDAKRRVRGVGDQLERVLSIAKRDGPLQDNSSVA